jgi:hypothetical protein
MSCADAGALACQLCVVVQAGDPGSVVAALVEWLVPRPLPWCCVGNGVALLETQTTSGPRLRCRCVSFKSLALCLYVLSESTQGGGCVWRVPECVCSRCRTDCPSLCVAVLSALTSDAFRSISCVNAAS